MKWNESGFRPPLCTHRLNWARRTSWGWWDDWDDTVLQTQDSKFEPWQSEAEHATSRSRRLPQYWLSHVDGEETFFVSFKPPRPGTEPRTLAWKAAVLTTTLGPPPPRDAGYRLRSFNNTSLPTPSARLSCVRNSFLNSSIKSWNSLDKIIRSSPSYLPFKTKLLKRSECNSHFNTILYSRFVGKAAVNHTRMWLRLSALNSQRYKYNMVIAFLWKVRSIFLWKVRSI